MIRIQKFIQRNYFFRISAPINSRGKSTPLSIKSNNNISKKVQFQKYYATDSKESKINNQKQTDKEILYFSHLEKYSLTWWVEWTKVMSVFAITGSSTVKILRPTLEYFGIVGSLLE
ncbi:hypothetical protein HDU92_000845, partial [Lobulomyces angularis]